ncbi:Two component system response regulator/histidine kinase [Desulfonema limicola]|uniref:histidine kinase n=1 Tax=Desulfonema limicola TaxID=45656 RepID=A0A975B383_9BACT|nr:PAS domain-containing sensor histidine kinase [Desulfonema limicola]QTA77961.1 Two component system response regulator/histidine kinase [Desulfonema limicola]
MTNIFFLLLLIFWFSSLFFVLQKYRQVKKDLIKIKAGYNSLFENMSNGVTVFKAEDNGNIFIIKDINTSGEKIYKISKQDAVGKSLEKLFPYIKDFGLFEAIQRVNKTGNSEYHPDIQYENEKLVGWRRHFLYKLPSGEIVSIYSDDTQQKLTELALVDFESRYRTLFNNANDAILVHDSDNRILEINRIACELLGYEREELEQMMITDIIPPDQALDPQHIQKLQQTGSLVYETAYCRKDGEIIPVEISSRIIEYDLIPVVMTLARDIRERKQAENEKNELLNQLRQSHKMEAIGTLAGGIAHDFNNILQIIFGYTQLAMFEAGSETLKAYLSELSIASHRAKDLVEHILTFSRQGSYERQPLIVQPIIKETLKLIRATLPATIEIRQEIDSSCPSIMADPIQIHQMIMNLCTNAYHAMRNYGGILKVTLTQTEIMPEDTVFRYHLQPGRYLCLSIGDTGHGMDQSIIERVFDPYFTTKNKGEGTGLGLSVVHGIVKSMEGHISVYSETGQGTNFYIWLPLTETEKPVTSKVYDKSITGGSEHILLIDDESSIIKMEEKILKSLGYQITTRMSSLDACVLFEKHPDRFDLVITDMAMPNMSGADLAEQMIKIRPDIPIIMCTGFSEIVSEKKAKKIGIREYITKPVIMKDLAAVIRKTLDNSR